MKTVAKEVETFESVMEILLPTGELASVSMSHMLQAYPEYAKPISRSRLREILAETKTKDDLEKLWMIYRGYEFLEKQESVKYDEERAHISWKIDEIVATERDLPKNKNLEAIRTLYKGARNRSDERRALYQEYEGQLRKLIDPKKDLIELTRLRRTLRIPPEFSHVARELQEAIHHKALDGIRATNKPEVIFDYLDMKGLENGVGLTFEERLMALRKVMQYAEEADTAIRAVKYIQESRIKDDQATPSEKDLNRASEELEHDAWSRAIARTTSTAFLWSVLTETRHLGSRWHVVLADEAMVHLMKKNTSLPLEELRKIQAKDSEFSLDNYPRHSDFGGYIRESYARLIAREERSVVEEVYKDFFGSEKRSWKYPLMLAAVRRLYELSQSK